MSHNILVTGASGYLGGTLLARWSRAKLPAYHKLYALVRTNEQGEAVKQYGAEPITFDVKDETSIMDAIIDKKITIVLFLIDAMTSESQVSMIKALGEMRKQTGQKVHFLHTSGAKIFSNHAGHPTDRPLPDNDPSLYHLQKTSQAHYVPVTKALEANNTVIEVAEQYGVKSYIFVPCVVYGKGEGFGNPISIQTVAIVNAAKKLGRVYRPDADDHTWPVCHVVDNAALYLEIIRNILSENSIASGKSGYYLAASGSVAWNDIYCAMAKELAKRQVVDKEEVDLVNDQALEQMGVALGCPKDMVPLFLGGKCTLEAKNGLKIGWKPQYPADHILEVADKEVDLILDFHQKGSL
ncbi:hypothetical protein N7462_006018 [Penicillium macrosclerotiorum]|uniref:uncharacterized protein n=1 Tax=Penicillium macrosclerotiorum TaxID=303699 RepID=UPI0025497018|nr:uncharacterized protein N7462_006018 [Penicillium macrosclerotiorum]KAJ5682853.1 hypothetical protein N7462_006018 [Penicillium macrosclerotiorum]